MYPICIIISGFLAILAIPRLIFAGYNNTEIDIIKAHSVTLRVVRFSPDGKLLATGSHDGTIKFWDTSSWHLIRSLKISSKAVYSLAFSPDRKLLASASQYDPIIIWEPLTGRKIRSVSPISTQHTVLSVAFSPDGKILAAGNDVGNIMLWNTSTWRLEYTLNHTLYANDTAAFSPIWELSFSPDGQLLSSAGGDGQSRVWDIKTRTPLAYGRNKRSVSVVFSPNNKFLAVASDDGPIIIWDVKTGQKLPAELALARGSDAVAFSPDGGFLASGGSGVVKLWDTRTWRRTRQWTSSNWIRTLCFSPRGNILAMGSDSGSLVIWDIH
jgi:WD40 repeat protein